MTTDVLDHLKTILREKDIPFFSDADLEFHYMDNGEDIKKTLYTCLLIKAEDTTLSVSGLSCADTSKYFRRLASMYVPTNSGILN